MRILLSQFDIVATDMLSPATYTIFTDDQRLQLFFAGVEISMKLKDKKMFHAYLTGLLRHRFHPDFNENVISNLTEFCLMMDLRYEYTGSVVVLCAIK